MELGDALAWLDSHQNLERMLADTSRPPPDLNRMRRLMSILGDPQKTFPVVHLTGTNGKTSTARALTAILMAKGLSVGTFTSPHLEAVNERITANGRPISDQELAEVLSDLALIEQMLGDGPGRPTWFELLTAAGFRWFAERPVDVGVIEVGLGGRWDATNVAHADVAVVTNVGLDHVEFLGPTVADVAGEKAGIIKAGTTLVLSETSPDLVAIFEAEAQAQGADRVLLRDRDFEVMSNDLAVGGRLIGVRTPTAEYYDVFLALHGRHQAYNFLDALVAAEEFFGAPIEADLLAEAAATVRSPGRLEIMGRRPLIVLDGAKNIPGAEAMAAAIDEEFGDFGSRIMVVGMLRGKDPGEMLQALGAAKARCVVACPPPSPRAQPADVVAKAALLLGVEAEPTNSVSDALDRATQLANEDDLIVVTGSLYVVGAARAALGSRGASR